MKPNELRQRRLAAGVSQGRLAELAEIPQPHISAMENGQRVIGDETGPRLERALQTVEREAEERRESMRRAVGRAMEHPHLVAMRKQLNH